MNQTKTEYSSKFKSPCYHLASDLWRVCNEKPTPQTLWHTSEVWKNDRINLPKLCLCKMETHSVFQSSQHLIKKRIKGGIVTCVQLRTLPPFSPSTTHWWSGIKNGRNNLGRQCVWPRCFWLLGGGPHELPLLLDVHNQPLNDQDPDITNDILQPNNGKMSGKDPRYI